MLPVKHFTEFTNLHFHRKIGILTDIMLLSDRCSSSLQAEIINLIPAVWLGQVDIFFNRFNTVCAFGVWANTSDDTNHRLLKSSHGLLDETDWNEGKNLWAVRFFTIPDAACASFTAFKKVMLTRGESFKYRRFPPRNSVNASPVLNVSRTSF